MSNPQNPQSRCPSCGASNASHARFCTSCGNSFSGPTQVTCPNCGVRSASDARFCTSCGSSFSRPSGGVGGAADNRDGGVSQRVSIITNTVNSAVAGESGLSQAGFVIAVIAIIVFVVALIPCFGCINWINIPVALIGLVLNVIVIARGNYTGKTTTALVLCLIAMIAGAIRLVLGGGIV